MCIAWIFRIQNCLFAATGQNSTVSAHNRQNLTRTYFAKRLHSIGGSLDANQYYCASLVVYRLRACLRVMYDVGFLRRPKNETCRQHVCVESLLFTPARSPAGHLAIFRINRKLISHFTATLQRGQLDETGRIIFSVHWCDLCPRGHAFLQSMAIYTGLAKKYPPTICCR